MACCGRGGREWQGGWSVCWLWLGGVLLVRTVGPSFAPEWRATVTLRPCWSLSVPVSLCVPVVSRARMARHRYTPSLLVSVGLCQSLCPCRSLPSLFFVLSFLFDFPSNGFRSTLQSYQIFLSASQLFSQYRNRNIVSKSRAETKRAPVQHDPDLILFDFDVYTKYGLSNNL